MKAFLVFLFCFSCVSQVFPQTSDSLKYCAVVVNDSGVYLPKLKVRIVSYKKADAFEKSSQTDFSGTACFTLSYGRDYNIIIDDSSYIRIKRKISFSAGTVFLSDTISLTSKITSTDVINVEAQKDFMRVEDDKTVFDISKLGLDPGPNALELMKKIPMVTVEGENVLLRGSSPKILINGRESAIYGDLKSIPTDLIDKIEIMTVAPSKYEAEGSSGVINVILKKFDEAKYRGYLSSYASSANSLNGYENLSFKKGKLSFLLSSNANLYRGNNSNYYYTKNLSSNELVVVSSDTSKSDYKSIRLNPGMIYDANKNLYFGVEGVLNLSDFSDNSNTFRQYSFEGDQIQKLISSNSGNYNTYSLIAYMNQKEIFKQDELTLEFNLNNTRNNYDTQQDEVQETMEIPFTNSKSDIKNDNYSIKFDYEKKYSEDLKLETGLKDTYKKEINDFNNTDTSGYFTSDYEFKQNIYSYYGTLSYNNKTFRFKPGLRIEYADVRGLVNSSYGFTNFKFDVFPSLTVTKFLSDNTQLQLIYGRKIDRPRFNELNPFSIRRDLYNTSAGNPDLQPSYINTFEFKMSKPVGKNYLNANVYYKRSTDLIQRITNIDSIYTSSTYINNGYSNEYGVDGGIRLSFGDFFYGNIYGRVSKKAYSDETLNAQSNRVSYNVNGSAGYSNPDMFDLNMYVYYSGQSFSPSRTSQPYTMFSIYASKSFIDRKLTISLSVNDLFKGYSSESSYMRNGFEQYYKSDGSFSRSFGLSVSFTFGNYDEKRQRGKDIKADDYGE